MATARPAGSPPGPDPSRLPPVPASPTYSYASTALPAGFNLPVPPPPPPAAHAVLNQADLDASRAAYTTLLSTAKAYRQALATLSTASSAFGSALESCARLKESRADALAPPAAAPPSLSNSFHPARAACTADTLLATAGLHHLVANHQQILSETLYRAFELPLLHDVDKWASDIAAERASYAAQARARAADIRRLEKEGAALRARARSRGVAAFREHLVALTGRLDGLTALHAGHARALLRESQECSARVADAACSVVRAEVDIFESLARKGWTGGGLDEVLERGEDLFAREEGAGEAEGGGGKLFSILPPKSILGGAESATSEGTRHGRADSLMVENDRYQSLVGAVGGGGGQDSDSVFSEPPSRPRGAGIARPFSPVSVRLDPEDGPMGAGRLGQLGSIAVGESSASAVVPHDTDAGADADLDLDATPRPSGFKMLRRALDEQDEESGHPWRDEGGLDTPTSESSKRGAGDGWAE